MTENNRWGFVKLPKLKCQSDFECKSSPPNFTKFCTLKQLIFSEQLSKCTMRRNMDSFTFVKINYLFFQKILLLTKSFGNVIPMCFISPKVTGVFCLHVYYCKQWSLEKKVGENDFPTCNFFV